MPLYAGAFETGWYRVIVTTRALRLVRKERPCGHRKSPAEASRFRVTDVPARRTPAMLYLMAGKEEVLRTLVYPTATRAKGCNRMHVACPCTFLLIATRQVRLGQAWQSSRETCPGTGDKGCSSLIARDKGNPTFLASRHG